MKIKLLSVLIFALFTSVINAQTVEKQKVENNSDYSKAFMQLLYEKSVKYSDKAETAVDKTVDLVMKEAEPTFREYITWAIIDHSISAAISIGMFFIGLLGLSILFFVKRGESWMFMDEVPTCICAAFAVMTFIGLISTIAGLPNPNSLSGIDHLKLSIKASVSPRIYVIGEFTDFIKQQREK